MEKFKLSEFTRGWLIGNFHPSIIKTDQFEFALQKYQAGDVTRKHYHRLAKEITAVVCGKFVMNGQTLAEGDMAVLEPGEPAEFKCLETGTAAVIKMPSVLNDKYLIN
jgi:quercetin dioxygenase-like cupin family protein